VKGSNNAVYGDAIASFGILYAFTTVSARFVPNVCKIWCPRQVAHVILMAMWRHGEEDLYGDESHIIDKKEYEQVGTAPSTST